MICLDLFSALQLPCGCWIFRLLYYFKRVGKVSTNAVNMINISGWGSTAPGLLQVWAKPSRVSHCHWYKFPQIYGIIIFSLCRKSHTWTAVLQRLQIPPHTQTHSSHFLPTNSIYLQPAAVECHCVCSHGVGWPHWRETGRLWWACWQERKLGGLGNIGP